MYQHQPAREMSLSGFKAEYCLQARLGCNAELILDEFGEKLLEELDYNQEARNLQVSPHPRSSSTSEESLQFPNNCCIELCEDKACHFEFLLCSLRCRHSRLINRCTAWPALSDWIEKNSKGQGLCYICGSTA